MPGHGVSEGCGPRRRGVLTRVGGRVGRRTIPKGRKAPYLWRAPGSIGPFLLPPAAAVLAGPEPRSRWSAPLDERP